MVAMTALAATAHAQDPVQVVLLAGQSNMDGNVPITELPLEFRQPPAKVSMIDRGQPARIAGVYLIETDDLGKQSDRIHYDAAGQITLGRRISEAWLRTVPPKP